MQSYENRSYQLISPGSGKISAALAKMCQQGEIGESLFRSGITQASFCLFLVRLARIQLIDKKKTDDQAANAFLLCSGGNASAAQKALASCSIKWEALDADGNPILMNEKGEPDANGAPSWEKVQMSVESYWKKGAPSQAPNLSDLD